jgi:folate-binding protein YgfZ
MSSPLHDAHTALHASFASVPSAPDAEDGHLLPARYTDLDAEVAAVRAGAGLIDMTHIRPLTLSSPDVKRWCNGMFTNNIRKLQPGQGNRSAICDDRGRVQGVIDAYLIDPETILATLDGVSPAWFSERFKMLMFLDDIELEVAEGAPWLLSLQGPLAAEQLAAAGLPIPEADHAHQHSAGVRVTRKDRTGLGGYDLLCDSADILSATWSALCEAGATPLGHDALEALRILAGRARWPHDGTHKSMVHELCLNVEVCAFDKGFYVGQEVINRIDVKGLLQKRLTLLQIDGEPALGTQAYLGSRRLGPVTSLIQVGGVNYGLAVLRKMAWEPGTAVELRVEDDTPLLATVISPVLSA